MKITDTSVGQSAPSLRLSNGGFHSNKRRHRLDKDFKADKC